MTTPLEPSAEARSEWIKVAVRLMVNESDKQIATVQMHCLMDRIDDIHYANKDLVDENKKMREALEFYAEGKHVERVDMHYQGTEYHAKDKGEVAKKALSSLLTL